MEAITANSINNDSFNRQNDKFACSCHQYTIAEPNHSRSTSTKAASEEESQQQARFETISTAYSDSSIANVEIQSSSDNSKCIICTTSTEFILLITTDGAFGKEFRLWSWHDPTLLKKTTDDLP